MTKKRKDLDRSTKRDSQEAITEIREAYLSDSRPWIVGYSGGKDSTATLQLVWNALVSIPEEKRKKPVYVISSDTLVETPQIIEYIDSNVTKINEVAIQQKLPITAEKLKPIINETFWVNLIGRGYPAPTQRFRWCTDRLKIQTSARFIKKTISKYGEVIIVLGTRKSESASRAKQMKQVELKDSVFSRNSHFSAASSYAPVRDWNAWNVWTYLMENPSPWGNDNDELARMYKDAEGECPFVVDDTTPPCGTSRFGCWVCTLVERDKCVEALIQSGEEWLKPLLEIRDLLASTTDPSVKHLYRDYKRRMGYVSFKSDGSGEISRGPYKFEIRKELLERLLRAQQEVRKNGPFPNISLITIEELKKIRSIWKSEEGDWNDSVVQIYKEIVNEEKFWDDDDSNPFNLLDREILNDICAKYSIPSKLVVKLIDVELNSQGMARRASIHSQIEKIFREEWRSEEEVEKEYQNKSKERH